MKKSPRSKFLNRYTTLPVLVDMLWRKQIALLSPQSWEDRNDAYYLERYQAEKKLGSVLALCFSTKSETFHHWRVFSHGAGGVCLEFDREELLESINGNPQFRHGFVNYCRIDKLEKSPPRPNDWPFLKRLPYSDESEYRIIYESDKAGELSKPINFNIEALKRVTLSPWMPKSVAESVKALIETIPDCLGVYVYRSSLIENGRWKKAINPKKTAGQAKTQKAKVVRTKS